MVLDCSIPLTESSLACLVNSGIKIVARLDRNELSSSRITVINVSRRRQYRRVIVWPHSWDLRSL